MAYLIVNRSEKDKEKALEKRSKILKEKKKLKVAKKKQFLICIVILVIAAIITILNINKAGIYPWGSDTFGHLFKGNVLYDAFIEGKSYTNYDSNWYNGMQLLKVSEPIPYYILAIINLFTRDIFITYSIFIVLIFIIGGVGFLCWGYYSDRLKLGLLFGLLWFFIPNNLRILFSEGNLPLTIVNALIPYLLLLYYKSIKENRRINYIFLSLIFCVITLINTYIAIMLIIALFIAGVIEVFRKKYFGKRFALVILSILGLFMAGFWLIPAINGGLLEMTNSQVAQNLEHSTHDLIQSINPFLRFSNVEVYYFGLSFILVAIFGLFFGDEQSKVKRGFLLAIIIFIGTSEVFIPVINEISFNEFLFISKLTGLSISVVLLSILLWKRLRKSIIVIICFIFIVDSMITFDGIGHNREFPKDLGNSLDIANDIAVQRIGVLDASEYGSLPSYYLSYVNEGTVKKQVFGWAWQNAKTSSNIININTALENNYFLTMFDRSLELGADTLIVKKSFIKDYEDLNRSADTVGYKKVYEDSQDIIYKYPVDYTFGTKVEFQGIAIGEYSSNIIYNFPNFMVGKSNYIDDYTKDELSKYKSIFLSGFKYKNKSVAEEIIKELSNSGVKVTIDLTGMDAGGFLGIIPQSIDLRNNYGVFYYDGEKVEMTDFPEDLKDFRCNYITGVKESNTEDYSVIETKVLEYKNNYDENITFLGLNIPYYATVTKDKVGIDILEEALDMEANTVIPREIVKVDIKYDSDEKIEINSDDKDVITSIAALDTFKAVENSYTVFNNLVKVNEEKVIIEIRYSKLLGGIEISIISIILLIVVTGSMKRGKIYRYLRTKEGME